MRYKIFLFAAFLLFSFSEEEHDIHVSRCDVEIIPETGKTEVSIRIFYDDFLAAFGLTIGQELPEEYGNSDDMIKTYIAKNFHFEINGQLQELKYVESISYPPAIWTTLEMDSTAKINEIKIKNTILLDLFDDQMNIVSIPWKGKKKTIAMDHKNSFVTLK